MSCILVRSIAGKTLLFLLAFCMCLGCRGQKAGINSCDAKEKSIESKVALDPDCIVVDWGPPPHTHEMTEQGYHVDGRLAGSARQALKAIVEDTKKRKRIIIVLPPTLTLPLKQLYLPHHIGGLLTGLLDGGYQIRFSRCGKFIHCLLAAWENYDHRQPSKDKAIYSIDGIRVGTGEYGVQKIREAIVAAKPEVVILLDKHPLGPCEAEVAQPVDLREFKAIASGVGAWLQYEQELGEKPVSER